MASSQADSEQALGPNSFNLETTMPLRESKTSLGPFRPTEIWNELIQHMKSKMELKWRRHKMRYYDNCFTGMDAVDVILHYLLRYKEISAVLTREKAVKVCQLMMSHQVFEPVGWRQCNRQFEDSGDKLYCFPPSTTTHIQENVAPAADDSDDDSLYDDSDNPLTSDIKRLESSVQKRWRDLVSEVKNRPRRAAMTGGGPPDQKALEMGVVNIPVSHEADDPSTSRINSPLTSSTADDSPAPGYMATADDCGVELYPGQCTPPRV